MNDAIVGRRGDRDAQVSGIATPADTVDLVPDTPVTEDAQAPNGGDLDLANEVGGVDLGEM